MRDVFICDAVRTAFGRFGGALATVRTDDLAAAPLRALIARNLSIDWSQVDDVTLGCANQAGEDNRNVGRMAALLAGLPPTVPASTINRLCGSSLDAISIAFRAIKSGECELMVAGGVESMTRAPFVMGKPDKAFSRSMQMQDTTIGWRFINPAMRAAYGVDSMPETAENLAVEFNISREDQDTFALRSQQRAASAQQRGFFAEEIVSVDVLQGDGTSTSFAVDEQLRPDTSLEALAKLKPIVSSSGTVTAGNASGINDGAGAIVLASEAACKKYGLVPRAKILATAMTGVQPRIMGIGPVSATHKVLQRAGLALAQMDVIELNEAFAAQSLAVLRQLKLADDDPRVNPNGGAIAIGHPLGASGARLVTTSVYQLHRTRGTYALCTMCIGVGQGAALVLQRIDGDRPTADDGQSRVG